MADAVSALDVCNVADLGPAVRDLRASTEAIAKRIETGEHGVYMRAAAFIDHAARALPVSADVSLPLHYVT